MLVQYENMVNPLKDAEWLLERQLGGMRNLVSIGNITPIDRISNALQCVQEAIREILYVGS